MNFVLKFDKMSNMTLQNNIKLKQLYQLIPNGVVISASWLEKNEISRQLRYDYISSNWLYTLGRSAYILNPKKLHMAKFLVIDLDKASFTEDARAIKQISQILGLKPLFELSKSVTVSIFGIFLKLL